MRRTPLLLAPLLALGAVVVHAEEAKPHATPIVVEAHDGALDVRLSVDPPRPRIGEKVGLVLTATLDGAVPPSDDDRVVRWPDVSERLVEAFGEDVVEVEDVRQSADGRTLTAGFRLYDAGSFEVPALDAELRRAGSTDEAPLASVRLEGAKLEIASVLGEGTEPHAGRGELDWQPERSARVWPWVVGGAVLVAALLAALLLRRRRALPVIPPPPPYVPPHRRALASLRDLLDRRLPEKGEIEPYFVELSEILRRYLEDRFGLRAPEQTTEEFLAQVSGTPEGRRAIDAAQRDVLRDFLTRADLVKFARATPDVGQCEHAADAARRFVEDTAPAPVPDAVTPAREVPV